ncbi:MAG: MoaD/ThiS family protein [Actinobacteria bacterium]|jgi:molybdopterin converting factor small subunit|nr:MoaD/ThiS family protein [Actinomycetota bacterium]NBP91407.1 MoaD/ThiS family protein [Actinomycetota bacterium]
MSVSTPEIDIRIPTILRPYTGGEKSVQASGATLAEVIQDLERRFPGMEERLLEDGKLRRFVNVYLNDEDVRFIGSLNAVISAGDNITILPAVAGGA